MGHAEKGAVVILRDVTRDREREATVVESERLNAVRLLAAGVAHEIGNPLNALTIHLQLLDRELRTRTPPDRRALLELTDIARKEVARLDLIITQFLRAVRPARPTLAAARVETVLQDTLTLLKQDIENRRIEVEVDCAETLPRLKLDKDQIKQAFFNIIRNALQAMPDGGRLRIGLTASDRHIAVSFQDNGAGISPSDFGHLFEPYFTTRPDGTGLGLMIVQRIIQEHGGRIDVHSEPGIGTTFTVFLPIDERRVRLLKAHSRGSRAPAEEEAG
jgi:signal transduction histidine kinase